MLKESFHTRKDGRNVHLLHYWQCFCLLLVSSLLLTTLLLTSAQQLAGPAGDPPWPAATQLTPGYLE